ncbi:MAG: O-antigen ligase family protein, partial [Firmicutes bacterium]|nr:O-antigen ligase family protein [Bacillota bacterium]
IPASIPSAHFVLLSVFEFTKVRASSFFMSGALFGGFSDLIAFLALSRLLNTKSSRPDYIMLAVSLFCVYTSRTRTEYLVLFVGVATLLILRVAHRKLKSRGRLLLYGLPYAYTGVFLGTLGLGRSFIYHDIGNAGFTSSATLVSRFDEWNYYLARYLMHIHNLANLFFGYGLIQSDRYMRTPLIVDNTFIAIYLFQGIFGLILFLILYFSAWNWLSRRYLATGDFFESALLANLSVLLPTGLISNYGYGSVEDWLLILVVVVAATFDKVKIATDGPSKPKDVLRMNGLSDDGTGLECGRNDV